MKLLIRRTEEETYWLGVWSLWYIRKRSCLWKTKRPSTALWIAVWEGHKQTAREIVFLGYVLCFGFGGTRWSPLSGTSPRPFLELLVLLFWILGTFSFPWVATLNWTVIHLCINSDHGYWTSMIDRQLVKPCHLPRRMKL